VWEEARQGFALRSWYGIEEPQSTIVFIEQKVPALAQLKASAAPVFIQDASAELNLPAESIPPDTGNLVMLPLLSRGNLLGAFLVGHKSDNQPGEAQPFTEQTLAILQGIAHQTAMVLENLRLTEASQEDAYVTAVLLQVAQAVVSQNEIEDIFDAIVHLMPILVGINACIIYLWDINRAVFQPAKVLTDNRRQDEELLSVSYGINDFTLLRSVFEQDRLFVCELSDPDTPPEKWPEIKCFPSDPEITSSNPSSANWLMGFPLSVKGEVFGVLVAKEIGTSSGVKSRRLEIINGIAQQIALAIMNEHLKQERVDRERLEREFQLARQIQETFLPSSLPTFLNWEMDTRWQTARQVGGDFYDIFKINDGRLGLVIADVSDKGMPAALYMTVTRTLIRANIQNNRSPTVVLEKVNRQLLLSAPNGMFITTIYAIISLETGAMVYANAGHNRPLLLRGATHQVETLLKGGTALGVLEKIHLQDHTVTLEPGDILTFYTDGVTESFSPSGEAFGEDRLEELIASTQGKSVCDLLDQLDKALLIFRENAPPSDDVTLLAIQRLN
jgi:sigma-B regulation protein RsbU (phosphoserine phosphatase)